jgi:hypothetical protein
MVAPSTCFRYKEIHEQTWRPPDGETNNQVDHRLIDERNASSTQGVRSCGGTGSDCDRVLVTGKYRCKIAYSEQEPNRNAKKVHVETLREPHTVMRLQQQLSKEFEKTEN